MKIKRGKKKTNINMRRPGFLHYIRDATFEGKYCENELTGFTSTLK
jgi:hypothetical protein